MEEHQGDDAEDALWVCGEKRLNWGVRTYDLEMKEKTTRPKHKTHTSSFPPSLLPKTTRLTSEELTSPFTLLKFHVTIAKQQD